jgi:hypothetical protein
MTLYLEELWTHEKDIKRFIWIFFLGTKLRQYYSLPRCDMKLILLKNKI